MFSRNVSPHTSKKKKAHYARPIRFSNLQIIKSKTKLWVISTVMLIVILWMNLALMYRDEKQFLYPPPIAVNCSRPNMIALTFDDGPSGYTPQLLKTLKANDVLATFFVIGMRLIEPDYHRNIIEKMALDGHVVGSHSWSHANFAEIKEESILSELLSTQWAIENIHIFDPQVVHSAKEPFL